MTSLIEGLTEDQSNAVTKLEEDQKTKFFRGISITFLIIDFKAANALKATDPVKASLNEKALFTLCGYYPSNRS